MAKRKRDNVHVIGKKMTLLQCLALLESIERDMEALRDHDCYALPGMLIPDLGCLIASIEHLLAKEKENGLES